MGVALTALAGLSFGAWVYLVYGRGGFWRICESSREDPPEPPAWPAVAVVIPARDEAETVGRTLPAVLGQDYPAPFRVLLVDDHSADATARAAERAAARSGRGERLEVVRARPLPPGWTGKLWALSEGLARAAAASAGPRYVWFTDADIAHAPDNLRRMVARAEADDLDLVSFMARLGCEGVGEGLLIPPFVFFFRMIYPFRWVNDPRSATAAAAGGAMLVRTEALRRAGGLGAIRGELIDDVALARAVKARGRPGGGRIRLALDGSARSVRPYGGVRGIWRMVARTAYAQLGRSPGLLAATLAGMALAFLIPPAAVLGWPLHGQPAAAALGLAAWAHMVLAAAPMFRYYGKPVVFACLLPAAALLYGGMTLHSALAHARGRGGVWKGRPHFSP